jgi:phenylacetate-CoA ligase
MTDYFDADETLEPREREAQLFQRLPQHLKTAIAAAPGLAEWLKGVDPEDITSREALARLPVLHKSRLMELQAERPPFGGFVDETRLGGRRTFMSPGPIWEPEADAGQARQTARAFFAAGIRPGDRVYNAFAYHMTPGGFMLDAGARALGCTVFPAGTGNTDLQVDAAAALRPKVYCGTPDFLKVLLDRAKERGRDLTSFRLGLVSGGALFPSLRHEYRQRGVSVLQCYATAEFGVIAYETADANGKPHPGMVVNEDLIIEIVRPGTGDPVPEGEVGELVVTNFSSIYPMVRLATGDLTAVLPGQAPCGRTNTRIKGWMGRADQRTKVKGMFVDPRQIGEIARRHPEIARSRLVVTRRDERDHMTLMVVPKEGAKIEISAVETTLREITKLSGDVLLVTADQLPNDGKVISDERDYSR